VDDENVFDITKGVAIGLFVKTLEPSDEPQIHYRELWGGRDAKYEFLGDHDVEDTEWETLESEAPYYLFIPQEGSIAGEYNGGPQIQTLFENYTTGVQTNRDSLTTDFSRDPLLERVSQFAESRQSTSAIERQFDVQEARYWNIQAAQETLREEGVDASRIEPYYYRPFDRRHIYYSPAIVHRIRSALVQHVAGQRNISLLVTRGCDNPGHGFCLVTKDLADKRALASPRGEAKQLFLYHYPSDEYRAENGEDMFNDAPDGRRPNLASDFVEACKERWGLDFVTDGTGDLETTFGPEDVLHYAYAVFHSPTYRRRYEELLRIDFPRLPLTSNLDLLRVLCEQGVALVDLHLMDDVSFDADERPNFPVSGSNEIVSRHPRYAPPNDAENGTGRVYLNEEQYFEGVEPDVWRFHVGGYQVCEKWLKDRKGRALADFGALRHYQNIVATVRRTVDHMDTIDTLIDEHGGWPLPGSTTDPSPNLPPAQ
jgi:predicted helicase